MNTSPATLTADLTGMLRHLDAAPGYRAELPRPGDTTAVIRIQGRDYTLTLQPRPAASPEGGPAQHNHDPNPFGRYQPPGDCPRCDQLRAGAPAKPGWRSRKDDDAQLAAEIRAHDCRKSRCGSVCTFGQW